MTARPKQSSPAVKTGVYTRISSDPSGERAGVDRQRADCEARGGRSPARSPRTGADALQGDEKSQFGGQGPSTP